MKQRMLMCDNDQVFVKGLKPFFVARNYSVSVTFTVKKSIQRLVEDRKRPINERYGVVIIDLSFHNGGGGDDTVGSEGFDILREAIRDPFIEPIILTGTGNEAKAYRAIADGAFRYVTKRPRLEENNSIVEAVRQGMESHDAIVGLANEIDLLVSERPHDAQILNHVRTAFQYILKLRGRDKGQPS